MPLFYHYDSIPNIISIVLSQGKGAFLLAGNNTMPASEKEKYNDKA